MTRQHWENIYQTKARNAVSWFREHLDTSLDLILKSGVGPDAALIDVGCGNSTLVDDLLDNGFTDLTALDVSEKALNDIRERLGEKANGVKWVVSDITKTNLPENCYDLWHDRAVFHFLTDADDRSKYVTLLKKSLRPGGRVIIAAFAADGPTKCSGLDIVRYTLESMQTELGNALTLTHHLKETHHTPFGTTQEFLYCYFKVAGGK